MSIRPESQSSTSRQGVTILKEILRRIKLNEGLIKENNVMLHAFLNTFLAEMKRNDELFNFLYQTAHFTGSFYSDLRISAPDEFDINLILKLPFNEDDFEIVAQYQAPSFMKYRLKNPSAMLTKHPRLVSNLFDDGYLIPENVRKWLQSVVDKALRYYTPPNQCEKVLKRQAGPARTIFLQKKNGSQIDIDLVPVISCMLELPSNSLDGRVSAKLGRTLKAFLVPKPYSSLTRQSPVNRQEARCLWRSHFPEAEEKAIHDLGCVKPVIKLLKLLRDKEDWKILASYYLKTVVMWMIIDNGTADHWKENNMFDRFVEALNRLALHVNQQRITYFFNKKHNLIEKMNADQARNIHNRLLQKIRKIEENPKSLWNAFHMEPSFTA